MVNKTFHITTYGCQMNEHDSENIAGMLLERGYTRAEDQKSADIVIFNTCSIRENADNRFLGTLGQLKKRKVFWPKQGKATHYLDKTSRISV